MIEFITDLRHANVAPLSEISMAVPGVFWPLTNAWGALHAAANTSMLLANKLSENQTAVVNAADSAILATSLTLFALLAAVVVVPAALRALSTQTFIFDVFLEVPRQVITALHARVSEKIEHVRLAEEAAELGEDVDDAGIGEPIFTETADGAHCEDTGSENGLQAAIHAFAQRGAARLDHPTTGSGVHSRCWSCCGATTRHQSLPSRRRYRNSSSQRNRLVFHMLWPLVVYCGYFVGAFMWQTQLVLFVGMAKSEVLWQKQSEVHVARLGYFVQAAHAYCEPAFGATNVKDGLEAATLIEQFEVRKLVIRGGHGAPATEPMACPVAERLAVRVTESLTNGSLGTSVIPRALHAHDGRWLRHPRRRGHLLL